LLLARLQAVPAGLYAVAVALVGAVLFTVSAYTLSPLALPALAAASAFVVMAFARPAYGIAGALLATPFDALRLEVEMLGVGSLSPAEAAMAVVGVAWLARALLRPESVARPALRDVPVAILLFAVAMGAFQAEEPSTVLRVTVLWTLFYLVYLQAQALDPAQVRLAIGAFVVAAGVLGAVGTWRYLQTGEPRLFAGGALTGDRAVGAFDDPNYYASLLSFALLPAIALIVHDFRRYALLVVPAVATLAGLLFSLSRGAILGFAVGLLVLLTWRRARRVAIVAAVIVTALTLAGGNPFVNSEYLGTVEERLSSIRQPTRESRRPEIWSAAADMAMERPFFGFGTNQFEFEAIDRVLVERGKPVENAHSVYFSLAAETGLIGLAAFLAFMVGVAARAVGAIRRGTGLVPTLALGLAAALLAHLVQGLTITQVRVSVLVAVLFLFAGMITGLRDQLAPDRSSARSRSSASGSADA
jgi:O-antigen ligase